MIKRETCYFCTSTFQLFSVLSLAASRKEQADLYIDPQFKDAMGIAKRVKKLGLFSKVRVINSEKIYNKYYTHRKGLLNHFEIARSYLYVDAISAMILGEDVCYKNIFVSTKAYMPRMVILHYLKHKCRFKVNYFDDGVGSYDGDYAYQPKKGDVIIRKLLFGSKAIDLKCDRYLLSPSLFKSTNPSFDFKLYGIDMIWKDPEWVRKLNYIFQSDNIQKITQKAIILNDPVHELFSPEDAVKMYEVIDKIIQSFGVQNSIIKKHPRSTDDDEPGNYNYYPDFGVPFEMICMNSDLNDSVVVSFASTAAATPKVLLDQEPYLILLYKLLDSKVSSLDLVDRYFHSIKDIYSDSSKIFIPTNMKEMDEILKQFDQNRPKE